jgi:hypothetical protein
MPVFTLGLEDHPLENVTAFAIDLHLILERRVCRVTGYVSHEFANPMISRELAELCKGTFSDDGVRVNAEFVTFFEGDLCAHRTPPLPIDFKLAEPERGASYFHLPNYCLSPFGDVSSVKSCRGRRLYCFITMTLKGDYATCQRTPILRAH